MRDVTGSPCARSTWSLYSLYSRDALTTTPSSRSTGTACVRLENMCTLPSITTRQCALPSPRGLLIYTPDSTCCATPRPRSPWLGSVVMLLCRIVARSLERHPRCSGDRVRPVSSAAAARATARREWRSPPMCLLFSKSHSGMRTTATAISSNSSVGSSPIPGSRLGGLTGKRAVARAKRL